MQEMNRPEDHEPEEDFSFDCGELNASDPVFPLFSRPILEDLLVETSSVTSSGDEIVGPYCEWSSRRKASPDHEVCKKSSSTGFSKIWRIKEQLVGRSSSDGRDAFVLFSNGAGVSPPEAEAARTKREVKKTVKTTSAASAHEVYLRSKAKGDERRRSYLPYRPELVGFFTNVNGGLTRNVHPY